MQGRVPMAKKNDAKAAKRCPKCGKDTFLLIADVTVAGEREFHQCTDITCRHTHMDGAPIDGLRDFLQRMWDQSPGRKMVINLTAEGKRLGYEDLHARYDMRPGQLRTRR